jgi:hypothetical protein
MMTKQCFGKSARGSVHDSDLARVIQAWYALPGPIRRAVLAFIGSE